MAAETTARVFGQHEAEAMFDSISASLNGSAESFLRELQTERELLLEHRSALSRLLHAVGAENFNRAGRGEMSTNLRAAIRQAEDALDG